MLEIVVLKGLKVDGDTHHPGMALVSEGGSTEA